MTTTAETPTTTTDAGRSPRRHQAALPSGIPRWAGYVGVTVRPVGATDGSGTRAWVASAGAGTTGVATLFFDTSEQDPTDTTREDQT